MKHFNAGKYIKQEAHKSFQPNPIHRPWVIDDMEVIDLLSQADYQLGQLNMYSQYVNIELYIQMHVVKEATQSTRIEGTQTNMEEAFLKQMEVATEKRDDWEEVQNYIQAMNQGMEALQKLPFCTRLIRQLHKTILQGVRGRHRLPGEFRRSQNWIGGASIEDAIFVPPVYNSIDSLMSDLESFANDEDLHLPELIKIALIHYQFETIHPFLDGNGRVGRLLITVYLVSCGLLSKPILYLSDFFEKNRSLYYDNLMRVRTQNDIGQWLKFFLVGVRDTAKKGVETFDAILKLQKEVEESLETLGSRAANARKVLDVLYLSPVIDAVRVAGIIEKSNVTSYKLIDDLEELGILKQISSSQRNRLYVFEPYLQLFKSE